MPEYCPEVFLFPHSCHTKTMFASSPVEIKRRGRDALKAKTKVPTLIKLLKELKCCRKDIVLFKKIIIAA